jgi:DNA-binding SARP family transcriptional activator
MQRGLAYACHPGELDAPLRVCLFGSFSLFKHGQRVPVTNGGKAEILLSVLALRHERSVSRETLLNLLWPNHPQDLSSQSLSSLIYSLRKQFAGALNGAAPIIQEDGQLRLNFDAGISVDLVSFEQLIKRGDRLAQQRETEAAMSAYGQAVEIYQGDLWYANDIYGSIERERLRAAYLTLLATLSDYHYARQAFERCLHYAHRLLVSDPCREDGHRLVMRCYWRRGERAQALRQYQLCVEILRAEFEIEPEQATIDLYEHIRSAPALA